MIDRDGPEKAFFVPYSAFGRPRTPSVSLRSLFPQATFLHCDDLLVDELTERSQECRPGCVFAAIAGTKTDGAEFIADALRRGAAGLLVNRAIEEAAIPQCVVPDVRQAFAQACHAICGFPSRTVNVAGVTGTNGKTTVTWMIRSILRHAGLPCGLLGTVEYDDGEHVESATLTTPDSRTFAGWLGRMAARCTPYAAVELSSHALHQGRAAGTELSAAVVTNITQDHFDYHGDFERYQASKARIAGLVRPGGVVVLNRDDPASWSVRDHVPGGVRIVSFSLHGDGDVSARIVSESLDRSQFQLSLGQETGSCDTLLIGRHNIENCLAAAAVCSSFQIPLAEIVGALRSFRGAPGRLERISCGQRFDVFVDYAHTDDALRRCLQCLRSVTPGRVLCVFGAGGDRDRTKRPKLGQAAQLADVPIVTSDNPRSEDPARIADDILAGFASTGPTPIVELDRAEAIRTAIRMARPGDSVLIAGKGHECEQIFRSHTIPFDDRRMARQALAERMSPPPQRKGA